MEKELKKTKKIAGITLIALVITIVVLIILAGVLINISLGNNGIFNKAKTAKEMYTNAQTQEETEIAKTTNEIDSWTRAGNNNSTDSETVLFEGKATAKDVITFANGHTYDEFDSLRFLYAEEFSTNKFIGFCTSEFTKGEIDYILNNYDSSRSDILGFYGYKDNYVESNAIENKNKITLRDESKGYLILRITGIKY